LLSSIPQQIQEGINTMSLSELPAELIADWIARTLPLGVSVVALCLGGGARYLRPHPIATPAQRRHARINRCLWYLADDRVGEVTELKYIFRVFVSGQFEYLYVPQSHN
jgi:hypothetical protein